MSRLRAFAAVIDLDHEASRTRISHTMRDNRQRNINKHCCQIKSKQAIRQASATPMKDRSLNAEEIEERLDEHVDAVLSSRRTAVDPALRLAEFYPNKQDLVLTCTRGSATAKTHAEMA